MKRGIIVLLALLLSITLFISCSNEASNNKNDLGYVTFGGGRNRGLEASISSAPGLEQLNWVYSAEKIDGGFSTGSTEEGSVKFNADGTSSQVGPFSVGRWRFTLKGYTSDNALIYEGSNDDVTITKGTGNTIKIIVKYQGGNGSGTLALSNVYIKNSEAIIESAASLKVSNGDEVILEAASTDGYFSTEEEIGLKADVYTLTFTFTDAAGSEVASATKTVFISTGKTTTVSGDVTEYGANGSFQITAEDESYIVEDNYYIVILDGNTGIYLNKNATAAVLAEAVNAAKDYENVTIYLNGNDIDLDEAQLLYGDTVSISRALTTPSRELTIDLDSNVISGKGVLFSISDGYSLTLKGGTLKTEGPTVINTSGAITASGVTFVAKTDEENTPLVVATEASNVTIEDPVFSSEITKIAADDVAITLTGDVVIEEFKVNSLEALQRALSMGVSEIKLEADLDFSALGGSEQLTALYATTLDLNGHTINGTFLTGDVSSKADPTLVTIIDSSKAGTGKIISSYHRTEAGALIQMCSVGAWQNATTIEGGAFISKNAIALNCQIQNINNPVGLIINDGTFEGAICVSDVIGRVTINNGIFNTIEYGSVISVNSGSSYIDSVVDIYGGSFTGTVLFDMYAGSSKSIVNVYGGSFTINFADGYDVAMLFAYDNETEQALVNNDKLQVNIYGGTFNYDPSAYVAEGYGVVAKSDGTYTVVEKTYVGTGDELQDAVNNAESGDSLYIELTDDISLDGSMIFG